MLWKKFCLGHYPDFVGFQTFRADFHSYYRSAFLDPNAVEVWEPAPFGSDVGMAYSVAGDRAFSAYFTNSGHVSTSLNTNVKFSKGEQTCKGLKWKIGFP